jgi:PIN domain nuclease of toxin-antitoxin system
MAWMLDTHALIWALYEPKKLGHRAHAVLKDPACEVVVSAISFLEISLKCGLGKLVLPDTDPSEIPDLAQKLEFGVEPLHPTILSTYHKLPHAPGHRDPFDRMLVWHAIRSAHTLLTKDRAMTYYRPHGLDILW